MQFDRKIVDQIKRHEGFRARPYLCSAGKTTIGWGRNLDDRGISQEEAEVLLEHDIEGAINGLAERMPEFTLLIHAGEQVRAWVLVNMAFNLGVHGLLEFRRMREALRCADYAEAAEQMLDSRWAKQVGGRALELAEQMRRGRWRK
ncbi:glycoside hydrolase family protein [Salidesulfovibrio brasiliensis]|uniref:glycoside hydrolase family protein n=1 Tax=Salidesulfovibrio brasiliensis TaxID=221711 RepID=UPI0006D29342|nr:glycoside hydrolase family protein [Salidesulfovibrio brasiliensis]